VNPNANGGNNGGSSTGGQPPKTSSGVNPGNNGGQGNNGGSSTGGQPPKTSSGVNPGNNGGQGNNGGSSTGGNKGSGNGGNTPFTSTGGSSTGGTTPFTSTGGNGGSSTGGNNGSSGNNGGSSTGGLSSGGIPFVDPNLPSMQIGALRDSGNIGGKDRVIQVKEPSDFTAEKNITFVYQLPEDTFIHSDPEGRIQVEVRIRNADALVPLPRWVTFDNGLLQIKGVVPAEVSDDVIFHAIGLDQWGGEASTDIRLKIK
jgi:hypothetical protein